MLVSVKMKTTKKTMAATLMIVMVLAVGITPIFAQSDNAPDISPNAGIDKGNRKGQLQRYRVNIRERIYEKPEEIDISELNEADVDPKIADALGVEAVEDEENAVGGLWILNAHGTTVTITPVTDAELSEDRIGLQLVAEKVKNTEFGALYEVHWGRVHHDDKMVELEGYALLDSDGVFYMSLDGEDLEYKAIGKVAPAIRGVRVAMKGYMTHDGVEYSHSMQGRAVRFGWFNRAVNQVRPKGRPEQAPEDAPVEPTADKPVTNGAIPA
jgi:hypothetical protein